MGRLPEGDAVPRWRFVVWIIALLALGYAFFLVLGGAGSQTVIFDPERYEPGVLSTSGPFFLYYEDTGTGRIMEEEGRRFLRVTLYDPERWTGFGFSLLAPLRGGEARVRWEWRAVEEFEFVQVDVREGEVGRPQGDYYEVFSLLTSPPATHWAAGEAALAEIPPNPNYQPPTGEKNGRLELEKMQGIAFTFSPGERVVLDVGRVEVVASGYSGAALVLLLSAALFLLTADVIPRFRYFRELCNRVESESEVLRSVFSLSLESLAVLGTIACGLVWMREGALSWPPVALLLGFLGLFWLDAVTGLWRKWALPYSFRYILLLGAGWLAGVSLPAAAWLLLLFLSMVPALRRRSVGLAAVLTLAAAGFLVFDLAWIHPGRLSPEAWQAAALGLGVSFGLAWLGIAFFRGVLQQEQIRRELERRQALSEALFQSVDEGVVVVRLEDFRIVRTNHEAATLLGRSPDKLVGEEIARVLSWPELGDASSWDTSSPIVREIEVSRSCDGKPAHLEALVQRFSYGGETFGVILLRDVEERRQVEERIRHAVKSEAIGRLAGGVAHDFNNLLTVINGNAELLLEDLEPGSVPAQRAREIYRAGQKAAQLVSQLLSYSRRQFLQTTVLDPADVLNGIRRMLERVLGKNVNLCVETPGEVPVVKADRRQLEQVFLNLAENARDAMPEGGVFTIVFSQVEISRTEAEQFEGLTPGRFLEIKVSDTGTGVPEGLGDRIFDPFVTTKEVGKGSGLGLASVYGVVRQHGGMITLASRPGEAARFRILLPAYCPREQANGKAGGMSA